jgi:hypothetical protein
MPLFPLFPVLVLLNSKLERMTIRAILGYYVLAIVLFALSYYFLTPLGNGVSLDSSTPAANLTFVDTIYFSVVTISSLGYGDLRPIGLSRILSSLEVLAGL